MKPSEKSSEEKMSSEPMKAIYERFIAIQDPKNNKISCSLKNTKILDSSHKKIGQGIGGLQATISQQNQAMNDRIISYEPLMKKPKPLSPLSATHIHIQFKNLVK
jgi:hypothetical protein